MQALLLETSSRDWRAYIREEPSCSASCILYTSEVSTSNSLLPTRQTRVIIIHWNKYCPSQIPPEPCPKFTLSAHSVSGAGHLNCRSTGELSTFPLKARPTEDRANYCISTSEPVSFVNRHIQQIRDQPNLTPSRMRAAAQTQAIICTLAHAREASLTAARLLRPLPSCLPARAVKMLQ